jgi:hypothetical protein
VAGPECSVHSPGALTCVAGHLIKDPAGSLEPAVLACISTSGPRGIFVECFLFLLTGNHTYYCSIYGILLQATQKMMIERLYSSNGV